MKQVKAIIRPARLDPVLRALRDHLEVPRVSVSHVQGFGQHTGREEDEDGTVLPFGTGEMCKVECIINDDLLDSVIALIQEAAHTGEHGDGEIFIIPVEAAVPIRTGRRETIVS